MDIQVEDLGPCTKRVKLSIPAEEVQARLDKSFADISRGVQFKGFRKGKVPRHMIEKRVGPHVRDDVKEELIREGLKQAIDDHDLKLIGEVHLHLEGIELDPKSPLTFETDVEVRPEFDVQDYKGIEVSVPALQVTDEEVERVLEDMRREQADLDPKDGACEDGDVVEGQITLFNSVGEAVSDALSLRLDTAANRMAGRPVPGLGQNLIGKSAGDSLAFELDLPEEGLEQVEFAGQPGKAEISIQKVFNRTLPVLDDDFASEFGVSDMDELRVKIRQGVLREKTGERERILDHKILHEILSKTPFELPDSIIEHELGQALVRYRNHLEQQGEEESSIPGKLEAYKRQARDRLIFDIRGFFVLNDLADKEEVFVTEREVDEKLAEIGAGYQRSGAEVREVYEKEGQLNVLRSQLKHDKVKKLLRDNAKITEEAPVAEASTSDSGSGA
ncbi:MAG: trigger factor [Planctomycetota bacterium]